MQQPDPTITPTVTISQLNPTSKSFSLIFEICQIHPQHAEEYRCRIVDSTGIIDAVFTQYCKYLKVGGVYLAKGLRCRVFDDHLRVEMMPMCSVEKHPYIMGFKDKENDLSLKYYVSKKEAIQVGIIAGEQKNKPLPVEGKGEKGKAENGKVEGKLDKGILEGKEERGEKQQGEKGQKEKFKKEKVDNATTTIQVDKKYQLGTDSKQQQSGKTKQTEQYGQKNGKMSSSAINEPPSKRNDEITNKQHQKRYIQKPNAESSSKKRHSQGGGFTQGRGHTSPSIFLESLLDIPHYRNCKVTVQVWLSQQNRLCEQNYWLGEISDTQGTMYAQFSSGEKIYGGQWVKLVNFHVYADKKYGYVLAEEESSLIVVQVESRERKTNTNRINWGR